MVIDTLNNCEIYYAFGERFKKAFEYLKNNDISKMELGRVDIDSDNVFIIVQEYTSKTIDEVKLEAHKKYADIHYVKEGFEYIGYVPIDRVGEPTTPYDPESDAEFYEKECELFPLLANDFAIVFPHDIHMPQKRALVPVQIRKAVIKVKVVD